MLLNNIGSVLSSMLQQYSQQDLSAIRQFKELFNMVSSHLKVGRAHVNLRQCRIWGMNHVEVSQRLKICGFSHFCGQCRTDVPVCDT